MTTQLNPSQHSHSSHSLPPTPTEISPPPLLLHPPPPTTQSPLDRSRNPATANNLQMSNSGGGIEVMNGNGTYLNGKVNHQMPTDTTSGGFKVPSGKEGSLKHRILTTSNPSRPNNPIDVRKSSSTRFVVVILTEFERKVNQPLLFPQNKLLQFCKRSGD